MDLGAPGPSGLLGSIRGFADNIFGSVHDRFELLSIELHEEKHRLIQTFVWITVFVFSAMLAVGAVSVALVIAFWSTPARVPVAVGLAAVYVLFAAFAGFRLRRALRDHPLPFAASLAELKADRACLHPDN